MGYFFLAIIAFSLGFVTGIKSKAQAKIKRREKVVEESITGTLDKMLVEAKQDNTLNTGRTISPPTPPPARVIKEGEVPTKPAAVKHMNPGYFYKKNTFVTVNQCRGCKMIGQYSELWEYKPCTNCGGSVKEHGAAKWVNGEWVMSKA
jgi:hypothetical protein